MTFKTITIPDPAEVGAWLDRELPNSMRHHVIYRATGWFTMSWPNKQPYSYVEAESDTPQKLLAELRRKLGELDPLAKAREQLEAAGYAVIAPD
jgi:hypothetical protein